MDGMQLINIESNENGMWIDGRELHEFLEVGRDFPTWFKDKVEKYGFVEGEDFSPKTGKTSDGGRPRIEYQISIDMAKELCMVENNEKGRQARKYFIECEKQLKHPKVVPLSERQALIKSLQLTAELAEEVEEVKSLTYAHSQKIIEIEHKVDEQITLDYGEQRKVQKSVSSRVYEIELESQQRRKLFKQLHREIKDRWAVASYRDIKRTELEQVLRYIEAWIPRKVS